MRKLLTGSLLLSNVAFAQELDFYKIQKSSHLQQKELKSTGSMYHLNFEPESRIDTFMLFKYHNDTARLIYNRSMTDSLSASPSILLFGKVQLDLNQLLKQNIPQNEYPDRGVLLTTPTLIKTKYDGDYILLGCDDKIYLLCDNYRYWIVINMKHDSINKIFCFSDISFRGGSVCFGDFNNDGRLDYYQWKYNSRTIPFYSFIGNKLVRNKQYDIRLNSKLDYNKCEDKYRHTYRYYSAKDNPFLISKKILPAR